jgi:hypothetical protein
VCTLDFLTLTLSECESWNLTIRAKLTFFFFCFLFFVFFLFVCVCVCVWSRPTCETLLAHKLFRTSSMLMPETLVKLLKSMPSLPDNRLPADVGSFPHRSIAPWDFDLSELAIDKAPSPDSPLRSQNPSRSSSPFKAASTSVLETHNTPPVSAIEALDIDFYFIFFVQVAKFLRLDFSPFKAGPSSQQSIPSHSVEHECKLLIVLPNRCHVDFLIFPSTQHPSKHSLTHSLTYLIMLRCINLMQFVQRIRICTHARTLVVLYFHWLMTWRNFDPHAFRWIAPVQSKAFRAVASPWILELLISSKLPTMPSLTHCTILRYSRNKSSICHTKSKCSRQKMLESAILSCPATLLAREW